MTTAILLAYACGVLSGFVVFAFLLGGEIRPILRAKNGIVYLRDGWRLWRIERMTASEADQVNPATDNRLVLRD